MTKEATLSCLLLLPILSPQVTAAEERISTTRHLSQGSVSLSGVKWDVHSKAPSGKSAVIAGDPSVMTVHLPEGFRIEGARFGAEEAEIKRQETTATVRIVPSLTTTLKWEMTLHFAPPVEGAAFSRNEQTLAGENTEYLVDVHPLRQDGEMSPDCSPTGESLDLGDIVYAKGIGVRGGSELTYDVSQRDGRFEAWVGIDPNLSAQRAGRFRVYSDRELVRVILGIFNRVGQQIVDDLVQFPSVYINRVDLVKISRKILYL